MADSFIGQIVMFGGNFAPDGWALCNGQLLAIGSNGALFSILGTTYGGDGRTTFGLPDLRGRGPIHAGNGPGLTSRALGRRGGNETNTITEPQLPSHNHDFDVPVSDKRADSTNPENRYLAVTRDPSYTENPANLSYNTTGITQNTGGNQSVSNMQPYLAVNFIICTVGIFP